MLAGLKHYPLLVSSIPALDVGCPTPEIVLSFLLMCQERKPTKPCKICAEAGIKCSPVRVGVGCRECTLQLNASRKFMDPIWFIEMHERELTAFMSTQDFSPNFTQADLRAFTTAYNHILKPLPINALESILAIMDQHIPGHSPVATVFRKVLGRKCLAAAKAQVEDKGKGKGKGRARTAKQDRPIPDALALTPNFPAASSSGLPSAIVADNSTPYDFSQFIQFINQQVLGLGPSASTGSDSSIPDLVDPNELDSPSSPNFDILYDKLISDF
ncbi:hypothetical protein MVEN_02313700 [Mycena venus]|uniref:Uncharacterized protein n=1 Tax=Mycena venus TaxID=2733690 RepID=A0A8H6X4X1_9AGAR|nr:hypothetical protein MVEN_02313700 [Mycena venus]